MFACNVKSFIYYEHHPNDYVMEHNHNCYECVFYMNGKGYFTVANEVHEYDGPTLTIVSPGHKHDETTEKFSTLFIVLFEYNGPEIFKPFNMLSLDEQAKNEFLELFEKMQDEEQERKSYYREMMSSYFSLVISKYLRNTNAKTRSSYNKELVSRTKSYIKENYKQKIDFEAIASSFGYSYDRFRHIFAEETKTSINQYLLNCRLYAAKQMLINTDMSVKEIAIECGFKNNVHFNNFFTSKMNISPLKFRSSSKEQIDVGVFKIKEK